MAFVARPAISPRHCPNGQPFCCCKCQKGGELSGAMFDDGTEEAKMIMGPDDENAIPVRAMQAVDKPLNAPFRRGFLNAGEPSKKSTPAKATPPAVISSPTAPPVATKEAKKAESAASVSAPAKRGVTTPPMEAEAVTPVVMGSDISTPLKEEKNRKRRTSHSSVKVEPSGMVVPVPTPAPLEPVKPKPFKCDLCQGNVQPMVDIYHRFTCNEHCNIRTHKDCLANVMSDRGFTKTKNRWKSAPCIVDGCTGLMAAINIFESDNVEKLYIKADKVVEPKKIEHHPKDKEKDKRLKKMGKGPVASKFGKDRDIHSVEPEPIVVAPAPVEPSPSPPPLFHAAPVFTVNPARKPISVPLSVDMGANAVPITKKQNELETKYAVNETQPKGQKIKKKKEKKLVDIGILGYADTVREKPSSSNDFQDLRSFGYSGVNEFLGEDNRSSAENGGLRERWDSDSTEDTSVHMSQTSDQYHAPRNGFGADVGFGNYTSFGGSQFGVAPGFGQPSGFAGVPSYNPSNSMHNPVLSANAIQEILDSLTIIGDRTLKEIATNCPSYAPGQNTPIKELLNIILCVADDLLCNEHKFQLEKLFSSDDTQSLRTFVNGLQYFMTGRSGTSITFCKNRQGQELEEELKFGMSGPVVGQEPPTTAPKYRIMKRGSSEDQTSSSTSSVNMHQGEKICDSVLATSSSDSHLSSDVVSDAMNQSLANRTRQVESEARSRSQAHDKLLDIKLAQWQIKADILRSQDIAIHASEAGSYEDQFDMHSAYYPSAASTNSAPSTTKQPDQPIPLRLLTFPNGPHGPPEINSVQPLSIHQQYRTPGMFMSTPLSALPPTMKMIPEDEYDRKLAELARERKKLEQELELCRARAEMKTTQINELEEELGNTRRVMERESDRADQLVLQLSSECKLKENARDREDRYRQRVALNEIDKNIVLAESSRVHTDMIADKFVTFDGRFQSEVAELRALSSKYADIEKKYIANRALILNGQLSHLPPIPPVPPMPQSVIDIFEKGDQFSNFPYRKKVEQLFPDVRSALIRTAYNTGVAVPTDDEITARLISELQSHSSLTIEVAIDMLSAAFNLLGRRPPPPPGPFEPEPHELGAIGSNRKNRPGNPDDHPECLVCMEGIYVEREAVLQCPHCREPFHNHCVVDWLNTYKTCPKCRGIFLDPATFPKLGGK